MDGEKLTQRAFVFGFGYVGLAFALVLKANGWKVGGTCRSEERRKELLKHGLEAFIFNAANEEDAIRHKIVSSDIILSTVPPLGAGDPVLPSYGKDILETPEGCWLGYLSTTGVYGDWGGGLVDEASELRAKSERGVRRIIAEKCWADLAKKNGPQCHLFRLAGIYGPGRNILVKLKAGNARRINKPGHLFSRIHVADIVAVLLASICRPRGGAVYNVCDDEACSQEELVEYGCNVLGIKSLPLIEFENAVNDMSAMARSFWQDRRRVSNRLMHEELGIRLRFPTYRNGLRDLAAEVETRRDI